ncbi:hypothetical protein [Winogradskyella ouciana]|uniref:Uncharacterized protein n=1 Tax=Winogradskyella ouciana TaxID=2608631 RepID=A0A7K1GBC4_9FLAO|nr:hypothetical protein [Winogradskyella ouciana]MTE26453.1 hypothetical protein [Winogradskyella ouciana]
MRNKSLNYNWGNELKELGYTKKKVNHFRKKYKKHWLCIDYDLMGFILMFRVLGLDAFNKTKCIKHKDIEDMTSLTQIGFINMVNKIENEFKSFIDNGK